MNSLDKIFKAYDIRGIYKKDFTKKDIEKIAKATATFLNAKKILVAMDARKSSPEIKKEVTKAITSLGYDVLDIGICTTPMFSWAINDQNLKGGIMITASHNPEEYNGFKISAKKAEPIGKNSGLLKIKELAQKNNFKKSKNIGKITKKNLTEKYVNFLASHSEKLDFNIIADFSCGASSKIVKKLSKKLGFKLTSLCEMSETPKHEGNPAKDKNTKHIKEKMKQKEYDLGVAFDTDADRIFFFTKRGKKIDSSEIAAMISESFSGKQTFVGNATIGKIFEDTTKNNGHRYIKSKVGHVFVKQAMKKHNAVFGAESSGHFYFKDFFYADSAVFAMLKVLNIIKHSKKDLQSLIKKYDKYKRSGEINLKIKDKNLAIKKIQQAFKKGKVSKLDGVSIYFENFWISARASNTENLLRINIEAKDKNTLKKLQAKLKALNLT